MVLPSEWLFLDRDDVFENESAKRRAKDLYREIAKEVAKAPEFPQVTPPAGVSDDSASDKNELEWWHIMAEVAESYPRLLIWLTEGQVGNGGLRNVFGLLIAMLRLIPWVRQGLRRVLFQPAAKLAPWRPA